MILGIGIDIVDLEGFRSQLAEPGSVFSEKTFTGRERRDAREGASGDPTRHLAGRFAAKEAFIKAWSSARYGRAPALASADMRDVEVVSDSHGRPKLRLRGDIAIAIRDLASGGNTSRNPIEVTITDGLPASMHVHLSISHDGGYACAQVVLEGRW